MNMPVLPEWRDEKYTEKTEGDRKVKEIEKK